MKKMNKKGFTLAELLIVVAIIAVLTAIAIPLFVGALDNAQDARDNANIRAVRGAATVYLLEKSGDTSVWTDAAKGVGNTKGFGWDVKATINARGEITAMSVEALSSETKITEDTCTASGDNFSVSLHLASTDIKDIPSAS